MRIDPGELDKRITLWRAGVEDDGTATVEGPPTQIGKRWAKKTDVSDAERMAAGENASSVTTRFLVMSDSLTRTITTKDDLRHKGRSYEITGIKESGEREDGIEITAATRTDLSA